MHVNTCVSLRCILSFHECRAEKTSVLDTSYGGRRRCLYAVVTECDGAEKFGSWACAADAKRLCGTVTGTGLEPVRGCFRDHIKEVSGVCLRSVAKLLEVEDDPTCREQIDQQCANVKIGEGRIEACLRTALRP